MLWLLWLLDILLILWVLSWKLVLIRVNNDGWLVDGVLVNRRHLEVCSPVSELAPKIAEHDEHKNGHKSTQAEEAISCDHPPETDTGGFQIAIIAAAVWACIVAAEGVSIVAALVSRVVVPRTGVYVA